MNVLVLHGPNLNLLGEREPEVYGSVTLEQINEMLEAEAKAHGASVKTFQSNVEGELVTRIHDERKWADAILMNPAAYTHTSIALRDAIKGVGIPTIEVHLSNVYGREKFRRHSYIAPVAVGQVSGFGPESYRLALLAALGLGETS